MNRLYFGDCLEILKDLYEKEREFIDLIYIDPPFNSKRNYNILFEDADLKDAKAQKQAFADTWSSVGYKDTLAEIQEIDLDLYKFLDALDNLRVSQSSVSYLTTMAIRIHYMHKVLKPTGSFYLHCDPTMSHYLKLLCDLIFGEKGFRNEIIWHYRRWTNAQNQFQSMHDVILFYSKSDKNTFNFTEVDMSDSQMKKFKRGWDSNVIHTKTEKYSQLIVYKKDKLEKAVKEGRMDLSKYKNVVYREKPIVAASDVIIMPVLNSQSKERLGYPTQKPEALLKRIIEASSNEGDLVADFFCGCGTTIAAAQELKRNWLGVDISHLATGLIRRRLAKQYGKKIGKTFEVFGFPKDLASAKRLSLVREKGRIKFQDWIIEAMIGGVSNPKKTADGGWDGHLTFDVTGKKEIVLIEVKSGNVNVKNLREFIQVVNKENASIGVFVCFAEQVTKPMLTAAKEEGYYNKELFGTTYDRIQIVTVDDLLEHHGINMPQSIKQTFKQAVKKSIPDGEQKKMFDQGKQEKMEL